MRLRISTILCLTLFALTNAAPSRPREESESAKKDDQAVPDLTAGADPYAYMSPEQQGDGTFNDCCAPGPSCANPCQQPAAPPQVINFAPPPPPPAAPCCAPGPACATPCAAPPPMLPPPPMPMAPPIMMPPPPPAAPCCDPAAAACANPCAPPMAPPMMAPQMMAPQMMAPPMMAPPMGGPCCDPGVVQQCANPCAPPAAADEEEERQTYAPYPGEITFKLMQKWDDRFLDENSSAFALLAGNVEDAIGEALGQQQDQVAPQNNYNPWDPYSQQYGQQQYDAPAQKPTISNIYFREGYVPGNPSTMPITVAHVMVNGGSDDASKLQALVTPDGSLGDGLKVFKDSFSAY